MSCRLMLRALALMLFAPVVVYPQDAATVLADAQRAMGSDALHTLEYSGSGHDFVLGQAYSADHPWPKFIVQSYRRSLDFHAPASRDQRVRRQFETPPRGGGMQPVSGDRIQDQIARITPVTPWAQQLDFWLTPHGFLKAAATRSTTLTWRTEAGKRMAVLSFAGGNGAQVEGFINADNLVEQVRTRIDNPVLGDMPVIAQYSDYREYDGVRFPTRIVHLNGDHPVLDVAITEVRPNVAIVIPRSAPAPVTAPAASGAALPTEKLADGIHLILGAGAASIAFDFGRYSVVMEAPGNEQRSAAVIAETKRLIPGKPIRYVIATHHHFDHIGGLRSYVAEGATIVAHESNRRYFERELAKPHTLNPSLDAVQKGPLKVAVLPVGDRRVLAGAGQRIELLHMRGNMHNAGLLIAWLPVQKMLIQADLWGPAAPGAAPAPVNTYTQNFLDNLDRLKLDVDRIVPIHYPADRQVTTMADMMRSVGRTR
jgi:glyoxylase-like metal-dependent hydrolase (beta-lactamase superfamily II)